MKKIILSLFVLGILGVATLFAFDKLFMPWYIESNEVVVPKVEGMLKDDAFELLKSKKLEPVEKSIKYDENYEKNSIIFQNPKEGKLVKEGRRIYLVISGGEPKIKVPNLTNKTLRDVKVTLKRNQLNLGEIEEIRSEIPRDRVAEQFPLPGEFASKGDSIDVKISVGPQKGMIRTPSVIGKSLAEAERILRDNSLFLGKVIKQRTQSYLPNTVFEQHPREGAFIELGDSVDVMVTIK